MRPDERVADAVWRCGEREVVRGCVDLLGVRGAPEGGSLALAMTLGGLRDPGWLAGGRPPGHAYWSRVWAARALLHVWDDVAAAAVTSALHDEHWRVREMAARVVARHDLGPAAEALRGLCRDDVPRVRAAAAQGLAAVGEGENAPALRGLADDPQDSVRRAAEVALRALSHRLDRHFD